MPAADSPVSLCTHCQHGRPVANTRGSVFLRCGWADADPRYPRYPQLPVTVCGAYAPRALGAPGATPGPEDEDAG